MHYAAAAVGLLLTIAYVAGAVGMVAWKARRCTDADLVCYVGLFWPIFVAPEALHWLATRLIARHILATRRP